MTTPLRLRAGVAADAPALARIHRAARAAALPGLRERWDEPAVAAWLAAGPLARAGGVTVAEAIGHDSVGYIARDATGGEVLHLYVAPAWRRRAAARGGQGGRAAGGTRAVLPRAQRRGPRLLRAPRLRRGRPPRRPRGQRGGGA